MILERVALALCAVALFVVMAVGAADIVSGAVFGRWLAFKVDLSETLIAAAIFLAWPFVQRRDEHIRVDLFSAGFGPRMAALSRWLSLTCALVFFALVAYGAVRLAAQSVEVMEISAATLGFPIWPWKIACAVGAALAVGVVLVQMASALKRRAAR